MSAREPLAKLSERTVFQVVLETICCTTADLFCGSRSAQSVVAQLRAPRYPLLFRSPPVAGVSFLSGFTPDWSPIAAVPEQLRRGVSHWYSAV